jgi:anti-sigma factor RsiW
MSNDLSMDNPDQLLAAFADGELDGAQNLKVLEMVAKDPALAKRVAQYQELRGAVAKAMDTPSLQAPDALREQIGRLAAEHESEPPVGSRQTAQTHQGPAVLAVIGKWLPAAVAAVLLIGTLVTINGVFPAGSPTLITQANFLNASLVDQFGSRHFKCSRKISPMYGIDQFPQDLTALPGALTDYFKQPINAQALNLSSLGYRFDVAGLCVIPGKGAVHLIYQSKAPTGQAETLSLWLRPFEEGSGIEPDRLYKTASPQENFPMLVWRHGEMVYYLVGDSTDAVERAFDAISSHQG